MFVVVYFTGENSVEVAPRGWLRGSQCYWPPKGMFKGQALVRAVERGIAPQVEWNLYDAKVLKTTGKTLHVCQYLSVS